MKTQIKELKDALAVARRLVNRLEMNKDEHEIAARNALVKMLQETLGCEFARDERLDAVTLEAGRFMTIGQVERVIYLFHPDNLAN